MSTTACITHPPLGSLPSDGDRPHSECMQSDTVAWMGLAGTSCKSDSERMERPSGDSSTHPNGKRILVVDDNIDAAQSAAEILRLLGNEVSAVYDGLAAVRTIEEWKPEVVLLDIGLPGIDGYEVARRVRSQDNGRSIMLVALTGWSQDRDRQLASEAGFDHHWVKPVALEKLKEISGGPPV